MLKKKSINLLDSLVSVMNNQLNISLSRKVSQNTFKNNSPYSQKSEKKIDNELDQMCREFIHKILPIIMCKMIFPTISDLDQFEDNEEFENHRAELIKFYVNLVRVASIDVVLPFLQNSIIETFDPRTISSQSPLLIEVSLILLYSFGGVIFIPTSIK